VERFTVNLFREVERWWKGELSWNLWHHWNLSAWNLSAGLNRLFRKLTAADVKSAT
jgi:hypothetical protein